MKLSIIVPVYNVEKYLVRCLDSIAVEMCDDYELLLVDDGSTDTSGAMCDDFAREHPGLNVVVIHQPNGGLSAARNAGIDRARGEYLTFVDSDDYIDAHSLVRNMEFLTAHPEVDMLEYPVEVHAESPKAYHLIFADETITNDIFANWIRRVGYKHCYAWNKIYRSQLWRSLRFPTEEYYEDIAVMPHIIKQCHIIHYSSIGCYRYIMHQGSITTNYRYVKQGQLFENNHRIYLEIKDSPTLRLQAIRLWIDCLNLLIDMGRCRDVDNEDYNRIIREVDKQRPCYKELPKNFDLRSLKLLPLPLIGLYAYCHCFRIVKSAL